MSLTYTYADPYFSDILNGIQSYCIEHNAVISLIVSYSQFKEMKIDLKQKLNKLDGLIITDIPVNRIDYINSLDTKSVLVDVRRNQFCNVGYDEVYANTLIIDHLIDCGYKKIAYIGGPVDDSNFEYCARMMVYREALRKNGIPYDPTLIYNCQWNHNVCAEQVKDLVKHHPDVDAIFAGSDSLATVVISKLNELGYKCPDDIGVAGFNDIELSNNFTPPITTVRLPSKRMGELAAEVLIREIENNEEIHMQYNLPVELKIRKSTKKVTS
jgi:DNA-binding LacI/PurR family transcriptional regulator